MSQNRDLEPVVRSSDERAVLAARLAALDEAVQGELDNSVPANTKRAHDDDWNVWLKYCAHAGFPPDVMSLGLYAAFASWLIADEGKAPSTARRRLAGVAAAFRDAGRPIPKHISAAARRAVSREEERLDREEENPRGRGKAPAFLVAELRAIYRACPDTLAGLRDRSLVLLGFATAARRQEMAHLRIGDVTPTDAGLLVYIRWSKTGRRTVKVLYGQHVESCPVRAWTAWLEASGLTEGHAFRQINRHGNLKGPLHPDSVGAIVTRAAARAGLDGHRTAHGLRAGLATESRRAGHDAITIAEQGGWQRDSGEMLGYMRVIDGWGEDNALYGIGL